MHLNFCMISNTMLAIRFSLIKNGTALLSLERIVSKLCVPTSDQKASLSGKANLLV